MTKKEQSEQQEARATLRELLPPGSTVYTVLRHVSRSGMQRTIGCAVRTEDGIREVSYLVAKACGYRMDRDRMGVKIGGCGMDMGFAVVYDLSYALNPKGYGCIGEKCLSNDHSNWDHNYEPHAEGLHHWHPDGGYALRHEWI